MCLGRAGRDTVERSRWLLLLAITFPRLWMSTPESDRFAIVGGGSEVAVFLGGRTTTERRFHRWVSFSEMFLSTIGSLLVVLDDLDFARAGLVGGEGRGASISFLGKMDRMMALMLAIDVLRFMSMCCGVVVSLIEGGGDGFSGFSS